MDNRNAPLSAFLKICIALRYLAGAGIQQIVADSLDVAVSTVCRAIWEVVSLLLSPAFVRRFVNV